MKKLEFTLFVTFLSIFLFASTANAIRYYINDYALDIMWKQNGKYLKVWGRASGGHSCKNMKISISFKNTETHSTKTIRTYVKNFRPMGRNYYKTEVYAPGQNGQFHIKKGQWVVTDYSLNCLKRIGN